MAEQRWWDDDHDGWGAGGLFVMMGFMVVFWLLIAALVVWTVRSLSGPPGQGRPQSDGPRSPLDIAKERYAKGEINDEEFEGPEARLRRP